MAEGFEDLEYWVTVMRLQEEGAEVISVGPDTEPVSGKNALGAQADTTADGVDASELDGVVVPGGWAPDKLRRYPGITDLVRTVHDRNKTVGIICHGGLVAISAGIVDGVSATGRWASKTTWRTPVRPGWTRRRSAKATWSGAAWSPTSPTSAANSSPPWLRSRGVNETRPDRA